VSTKGTANRYSNTPGIQIEHKIRCRSGKNILYPEYALELQTDEKNAKMCQILLLNLKPIGYGTLVRNGKYHELGNFSNFMVGTYAAVLT
jgi:hypothetical protein